MLNPAPTFDGLTATAGEDTFPSEGVNFPRSDAEMLNRFGTILKNAAQMRAINVRNKFLQLSETWKSNRPPSSSIEKLSMHPSYQQIIGLGPDAIPHLLKDLADTGTQWFWALRSITGENPVREESRGNVALMTRDWLEWAERIGYKR